MHQHIHSLWLFRLFISHAHNHRHTHTSTSAQRSLYLVTNLNCSCCARPMGSPSCLISPLLHRFPFHSLLNIYALSFCPLPTSTVFLFWLSWADLSYCVSVGEPEFSSNTTSQRGLSLFFPSPVLLSFLFSSPLSFSSTPLFSSTSSKKDRGLGPAAAGAAEWRLWSDRKPRKVADRLLELIHSSRNTWTVTQSIKHIQWKAVHYKENFSVLLSG